MIPQEFNSEGDTWTKIAESKTHAVYQREGKLGKHWDVIGILEHKSDRTFPNGGRVKEGDTYLARHEKYYGVCSWCFQTLEEAINRFYLYSKDGSPDWDKLSWRILEKGEVVEKSDWVDSANDGWNNDPIWEPASRIGEAAPDPMFPAHRVFRRITAEV